MTVEVFHVVRSEFRQVALGDQEAAKKLFAAGRYEKVAEVDSQSLDHAFAITQNIDKSWVDNAGLKALASNPRSSAVGDIFAKDGKHYFVGMFGFKLLD